MPVYSYRIGMNGCVCVCVCWTVVDETQKTDEAEITRMGLQEEKGEADATSWQ